MKITIFAIILAIVAIGAAVVLSKQPPVVLDSKDNVSISNGTQIIDITAKGGYTPRRSSAKAGIPTILRVSTNGTFDCSSTIRIPNLNISKNLPQSGKTDIDLDKPSVGKLTGTCGMGMYPFEIDFQS